MYFDNFLIHKINFYYYFKLIRVYSKRKVIYKEREKRKKFTERLQRGELSSL